MNNFFQFLLHFIFIATFLFVYIIAIIILKPFRLHRKRKFSTITLKLSYLIYLAFFLGFVYLVLFAYAFFLEGYTGLSITILCIITLFVVMQATAKIDWAKQFDNIKQSSVGKKGPNQADDSRPHV